MTTKSAFRENLDQLTPEQFKQVEQEMAAARAARGDSAEYSRRVANMSPRELEQEWSKYGR